MTASWYTEYLQEDKKHKAAGQHNKTPKANKSTQLPHTTPATCSPFFSESVPFLQICRAAVLQSK
jgi:hypothetical protein